MDGGPIQITSIVVVRPELPPPLPGNPVALLAHPDTIQDNNKELGEIVPESTLPKVDSATFEAENADSKEPENPINHSTIQPDHRPT